MHLAASLRAVVVAAVCLAPLAASANPARAWAAAKAHLSGDPVIVVGVNVRELGKSSMVKSLLALAASDVKKEIDRVQRVCSIDPWVAIEAVVLASDADLDDGVAFIAVKDVDQARLGACLEAMARDEGDKDAKLVTASHGAITELVVGGRKAFVRWVGSDVIAIGSHLDDKAILERWTPKKGAFGKSKVGRLAAKANTKATVWGASAKQTEIDGAKVTGGYGAAVLRSGNVDATVRLVFDTPASAKASADKLASALASNSEAKAFADKVSVASAKEEMVLNAKLAESELMMAVGALAP